MIPVDFHSHSFFSLCGIHSHLEMLQRARDLGMTALAITDHGPDLKGHLNSPFFERLHDPLPGIRLLKGIESNLRIDGSIDAPTHLLPWCDIVIVGIHDHKLTGLGTQRYTEAVCAALDAHRCIDIIAHPDDTIFPLDFTHVVTTAKRYGVALELNNSKAALSRYDGATTREMLRVCKEMECPIVVNSDAHAVNEIGRDDAAIPFLREIDFPQNLVINATAERALSWVEERRAGKTAAKQACADSRSG